jgi:uncharacterized protein YpmB
MKKHEKISVPAIGGSSLLVIFAVLCMTVFALLSLRTAQAEKQVADAAALGVRQYYAADLQAQEIYARLRAGETVSGVNVEGNRFSYICPVSAHQVLAVELEENDGTFTVLRWRVLAGAEIENGTLPVWDGSDLP